MFNRRFYLTLFALATLTLGAWGQERLPYSFTSKLHSEDVIPSVSLPPIPVAKLSSKSSTVRQSFLKSLDFGTTLATNISIATNGRTDTVGQMVIHRLIVKSAGAKSLMLKLKVDKDRAFDSQKVFVYTPSRSYVAYTLGKLTNQSTIVLPIVPDESAVVEIEKPILSKATYSIVEAVHNSTLPLKIYDLDKDISQSCNVDVACPLGQELIPEKNSVVKIIINTAAGARLCSGVLINNTEKNRKPYILTAHHCILNENEANNATFYFGYEKKECGSTNIIQGKAIAGSTLRSTGYLGALDFSLVELSASPPDEYQPYYAGWDIRKNPFDLPKASCLHHPNGDVKKISATNSRPTMGNYNDVDPFSSFTPNAHWLIARWDAGTTEGGSSGSALFNSNKLVVGSLTGGLASCQSPTDDYFSRMNVSWNSNSDPRYQLKKWLDPIGSGDSTCTGMQPSSLSYTVIVSNPTPCDGDTITLRVVPEDPNLTIKNLSASNVSEVSGVGTHKLVWHTKNLGTKRSIVADFVVGGISSGGYLIATVKDLPPKPSIQKEGITLSTTSTLLNQWYLNGLPINNTTSQSTEITGPGKYYVASSNEDGCSTKSDVVTIEYTDAIDGSNISLYPIPVANGIIHIKNQASSGNTYNFFGGTLTVNLYDMAGRKVGSNQYVNPADVFDYEIPTSQPGVYILEIVANGKHFSKKIIVAGM